MNKILVLLLTAVCVVIGFNGAEAQVPTSGSQQRQVTTPQQGGTATTGTATRTNPSSTPFQNPIMQPLPPANSTTNPQQNYIQPIPGPGSQ